MATIVGITWPETSRTVYVRIRRLDEFIWDHVGSHWEQFVIADVARYSVSAPEFPAAGSGEYQLDISTLAPAATVVGQYRYQFFRQAGAAPLITDFLIGEVEVLWDGAALMDKQTVLARLILALPNAGPDTAGGLPTTTKITDARLAVLTDWINGGRLDLLLDAVSLGTGPISWPYTLTDADTAAPLANALIRVSTDIGGTNVIASGITSAAGIVTFSLDAGVRYIWRFLPGYVFTDPDTETVAPAGHGDGTGTAATGSPTTAPVRTAKLDNLGITTLRENLKTKYTGRVRNQDRIDQIVESVCVRAVKHVWNLRRWPFTIIPVDLVAVAGVAYTVLPSNFRTFHVQKGGVYCTDHGWASYQSPMNWTEQSSLVTEQAFPKKFTVRRRVIAGVTTPVVEWSAVPDAGYTFTGFIEILGPPAVTFGTAGSDGDIVLGTDAKDYRCILNHIGDATTKPITGPNYTHYWTQLTTVAGGAWVLGATYAAADAVYFPQELDALLEAAAERFMLLDGGLQEVTGSEREMANATYQTALLDAATFEHGYAGGLALDQVIDVHKDVEELGSAGAGDW